MGRSDRSQEPDSDVPNLLERIFAAGCTRIAVVSLHPDSGARTTLESLAAEFGRRGIATGVTRSPRLPLESDDIDERATRVSLPEDVIVATTTELAGTTDGLEFLENTDCRTILGEVGLYRTTGTGEVPVYGPDDPESLSSVLGRLETRSGGLALVDGASERVGFAAPSVTQGVVLAVGSSYSGSPERSAAAVRYLAGLLELAPCGETSRMAWHRAAECNRALMLNADQRMLGGPFSPHGDPTETLTPYGSQLATVVVPDGLYDEFLAPLTRSPLRFELVVRDATRIRAAPVYLEVWLRRGGGLRVVEPTHLLSVATNPYSPSGPDADPQRFRRLVKQALPHLPVHDVRLESGNRKRPAWKIWA